MILDSKQYRGLCSCGHEHPLLTAFSVIESDCLLDLPRYRKQLSLEGYAVAVYDENTYLATASKHPTVEHTVVLNPHGLHADETGVEALLTQLPDETEVLIAIGSGTVHDLVRYCAHKKNLPFISCPTAASVDGFCSSVAAMTWKGCKQTFTATPPTLVLADTEVIRKAPLRLTRSGVGDMLGKYIALTDWKVANILVGESYCSRIATIMREAVEAVTNSLDGLLTGKTSSYESLMYGLLLSGLCMQMMGNSRPASGAEHHISHLIEMQPPGIGIHSDALHGEKVGVATLLVAEEYHRLATNDIPEIQDYAGFSEVEITALFGTALAEEILKENRADVAAGIKAKTLSSCWDRLVQELKTIPTTQQFTEWYVKIGMKKSLSDLEISEDKKRLLLDISPCVRNRLTLMRLCRSMLPRSFVI